jgi:uncharacterized protein YbaR (Trm112 family)
MTKLEKIEKLLACPECHISLTRSEGNFYCHKCEQFFHIENGIPVLFKRDSRISETGKEFYGDYHPDSLKNRLKRYFPLPNFIVARPTFHDRLKEKYIINASSNLNILNLGSGVQNRNLDSNLINLDIYSHENADVAADAHHLPFLEDSLDGVWLCAVMEHLSRPFDVAAECFRVVKPGGFVLITVPFIQPRHGSPHDYFRYTLDGLRSVFRQFEEIEGGMTGTGLIGTWAEITRALIGELISNAAISYGLRFVMGWLFYPLVLLDKLTILKQKDSSVAGGVCFLGMKAS